MGNVFLAEIDEKINKIFVALPTKGKNSASRYKKKISDIIRLDNHEIPIEEIKKFSYNPEHYTYYK